MSQRARVMLAAGVILVAAGFAEAAGAYKPTDEIVAAYKAKCQACHMADGASPLEPMNFADGKWIHGDSIADITKIIADGAPGTAMLAFKSQLTPEEIAGLARYVRSFDKTPLKTAGGAKKAKPASPKAKKSR